MSPHLDTAIEVAGLRFKSPVLVSSSEYTSQLSLIKDLAQRNIGGMVTKTFTTSPRHRIRVRPYQFPLRTFGKGYREGPCLLSLAAPHVLDPPEFIELLFRSAEICHGASLKLIASYFEDPLDTASWMQTARTLEEAGADMLELNFSSPSAVAVFAKRSDISTQIIRRIKEEVPIPVGLKLSPTLEPLESLVESWAEAGLDFITAHNAPSGIIIDVENQVPFGAPSIGGYVLGRAFLPYSLARVVRMRRVVDIPIIGVGGVYDWSDALQYLLCGCPLVGVGSAMYFHGAELLDKIHEGLTNWMRRKGYPSIDAFRGRVFPLIRSSGALTDKEPYPFTLPPDAPYVPIIEDGKCTRCGLCEKTCIYDVFEIRDGKSRIRVDESKCWSCGFCVGICPSGAIELRRRGRKDMVIWKNEGMAEPFRDR
ncbi:MAG: 4Fe-4S binding protein [Desulfatiglandaceae bacterium]